jgi:hypothetical protein
VKTPRNFFLQIFPIDLFHGTLVEILVEMTFFQLMFVATDKKVE